MPNSLTSEISYDRYTSAFVAGIGVLPAWFVKLVVLALIWAYLHHFIAGIRHLFMDNHIALDKDASQRTARYVLVISLALTLLVALKLFGVF